MPWTLHTKCLRTNCIASHGCYLEILFAASQASSKTYRIGVCILLNAQITHMYTQAKEALFSMTISTKGYFFPLLESMEQVY